MDTLILTPSFVEGNYSPEQLSNLAHLGEFCPGWFGWGRGQKLPLKANGRNASTKDTATEMTRALALASMDKHGWGGLGISMRTAVAGLVGIDLDNVIKDGKPTELGREAIERFRGAYVEISPSGTGLRIFPLGAVPVGTPKGSTAVGGGQKVEIYRSGVAGRFLRITGDGVPGTVGRVVPCQGGIDWLAGIAIAAKEGSPDKDNATAPDKDKGLSLDAVFDALAGLRPEKEAGEVIQTMRSDVARSPRGKLAEALKGNKARWSNDWSAVDFFLCCEAIRCGAGSFEDVCEVWQSTPLWRNTGKRKDYPEITVEPAARAVLKDLQKKAAGGGRKAAPAVPVALPEGLSEALALSGDTLTKDSRGQLLAQVGNVVVLFRNAPELRGLVGFNELTQKAHRLQSWQVLDRLAASEPGPVTDDDVTRAGMYLERAYSMKLDNKELMRALDASAVDARFDPLADDLLALKWDKVPRVGTWLVDWLKVDTSHGDGAYINLAGRCFLVGAVARALSPGCKMDTVLSVEGSGGGGKSTAFRVLADAVGPKLFADGVHDLSSTRAIVEGTGGRWIVEVAELAGVRKAEVNALKAALSQQEDTHRRAYDVLSRETPRRFVFVATTNSSEYLADPSGALLRRFWPVRTLATEQAPIDRAGLARIAPQLWAEAVHLFNAGEKWHIGPEDGDAYTQWVGQREQRRVEGAFQEEVTEFLANMSGEDAVRGWSIKEIAERVGDQKTAENDGGARMRLAATLTALNMERRKVGDYYRWFKAPSGAAQTPVKRLAATGRK